MNKDITDYYSHTIPKGKTIKLSNNITNTLIVLSKDRNKFIYPNPYDFVLNLENPYYDVIEIELVRLYFNYCISLINIDNNMFEFFYTINNDDYIFNMRLGEFTPSTKDTVKTIFNNIYKTTLELYIKTWFDNNISQILNNNNSSISYNLPKLFLEYNNNINRFYFYNMSKNNYKTPNNINSFLNNSSNILIYEDISYIEFGLNVRGNKKYYSTNLFNNKLIRGPTVENPNLHNYSYNTNKENLILPMLGFTTNSDFTENKHKTKNIDITIYSREYLASSFKVIGLRIKYNNGNTDIIGNGTNNTFQNYYSHLDYDITNLGTNIPVVLSTAPNANEYPSQSINGIPVDYAINIVTKPIFYQVLNITISKKIDSFIYEQISYALQSGDKNLGIKLEYLINTSSLGIIKLENFKEYNEVDIQAEYNLSYFNNLIGTTNGIYHSTNIYKRLIGYLGYQIENDDIIVKWGRIYKEDIYGTNDPNTGILLEKNIPAKIYNSTISNPIFTTPVILYSSSNFNSPPGIPIFNTSPQEYSNQEPQFKLFNGYTSIILITNFLFGDNNPCLETTNYLLLDIEELNNKDSNNESFNKSFAEIPINTQYLRYYDVTNLGYGTKYFNPPLKKIDRLTIKVKDINDNILKIPKYTNDYTLIFNVKQINNSSNIVIN